eukprot:EST48003.1 Hypothetical protein SS50377_11922 [Spironucleus salmonicida]
MEVSYASNVCDYSDKTVLVENMEDSITIINSYRVTLKKYGYYDAAYHDKCKFFQVVDNVHQLIDTQKLILTSEYYQLANLVGQKLGDIGNQELAFEYKAQVFNNQHYVVLKSKVLICELNGITAIWLTEAKKPLNVTYQRYQRDFQQQLLNSR